MATTTKPPINNHLFLLSSFLFGALLLVEGFGIHSEARYYQGVSQSKLAKQEQHVQGNKIVVKRNEDGEWRRNMQQSRRRMMIGSTMPTCTYNECRGCKYKCRAEQIPVDGNDPINSAYHYKCVCHRKRGKV